MDPVQSSILFLNYLSFLADFIMSGSVFHNMLPLNLNEFNRTSLFSYLVAVRDPYSKIVICGSTFEEILLHFLSLPMHLRSL